MKKYVIQLIAILFSYSAFCQSSIDSLKNSLNTSTAKGRVDILNILAELTSKSPHAKGWVNRADSQKHYASLALSEAEAINYNNGIAKALVNLSSSQWLYGIPLVQGNKDYMPVAKLGEEYALKALPIAQQLNLSELIGDVYYNLSGFQYYLNNRELKYRIENYKKAVQFYKIADHEAKENEATTWLCDQYMMLGQFEEGFEFCQRSAELARKGMNYAKTKEDLDYRIFLVQQSLVNLASLHQQAADYEQALEYLRQSRQFGSLHNSNWSMSGEIGSVYMDMAQFDSSRYYHELQVSQTPKNDYHRFSLADLYVAVKEYNKALELLKVPYESYRSGKGSARVLLPMAKAYNVKKDYTEALSLARESFSKINKTHRPQLMQHYKVLADIHHNMGNNDSAYYYQLKYQEIKETMLSRQFIWQLNNYKRIASDQRRAAELVLLKKDNLLKQQQLKTQFILQKQGKDQLVLLASSKKLTEQQLMLKDQAIKENALLQQQKLSELKLLQQQNKIKDQQLKQQMILRNTLMGGLFVLLAIGVFIFRLITLKQKNERLRNEKKQAKLQQQSSELEMQALRAQMNPHFIFNCLSSINKFILKNESRAASDYLTRFSRLIRTVLTNSQLSRIPLSDEVEMLRLYLEMERLRFSNSFDYNITYENAIEPELVYLPPMILQPICENAIWHGLMHKEGNGKLDVCLSSKKGWVECVITDNGVGRKKAAEFKSKNSEHQKSFGLKITTERLAMYNEQKQGSYEVTDLYDENGNAVGTSVRLLINTHSTIVTGERELI